MKLFDAPLLKARRTELPMVPLRDIVVFPHMIVPFFVGRPRSVRAVEQAMGADRLLFLAAQKNTDVEDPQEADIHRVGTIAKVLQMVKLPDGTMRLLVEGVQRARATRFSGKDDFLRASTQPLPSSESATQEVTAMMRAVVREFSRYSSLSNKVPADLLATAEKTESPDLLVDLICGNTPLKVEQKVEILGTSGAERRLESLATALVAEISVLEIERDINEKVRSKLERSQKEYFLHEQMKEIQRELGGEQDDATGVKELEERLRERRLPEEVAAKCQKELKRLGRMQPMSPESAVLRTYVEWIADLPWDSSTLDSKDIELARDILDQDHFDLKKVKERILDFIAVRQLKDRVKGPILCFVGPPGTGKTSLGRSVARALGRKFVRISLGGVRDEAEIRGHRKTYVGALPGKILQAMRKAGTVNPVFLLDEVDKMSSDYRGDPASALLEVLDPEQNSTFVDHYLEVPYDLSHVMFITTANSVHNIPYALRDRMEVIEIQGYSEYEKLQIAQKFLIRKQIEENGLEWASIAFRRSALLALIRNYTMESGVRNLEREIANTLRKIARDAVAGGRVGALEQRRPQTRLPAAAGGDGTPAGAEEGSEEAPAALGSEKTETVRAPEAGLRQVDPGAPDGAGTGPAASDSLPAPRDNSREGGNGKPFRVVITESSLARYLGTPKHTELKYARDAKAGLAYGLAWTELGGMLLPVEVALLEGKGKLTLTGSMGSVMKESAQTALSFLRANAGELDIPHDFTRSRDIHIHIPEGAIPKDGPSAGITIAAALLSAIRGSCVREGYAMTGEITLTGRLLPIGGLKEKALAARRHGFPSVLLPSLNRRDEEELPREVLSSVSLSYHDTVLGALKELFELPQAQAG